MSNEHLSSQIYFTCIKTYPLTFKKSLMSSPDIIPGKFNSDSVNSFLFIVLLHFFLLTLHMDINNESLRSNLVKVRLDIVTSTGIQE